jgi:hypothetical protein
MYSSSGPDVVFIVLLHEDSESLHEIKPIRVSLITAVIED